MYKYILFTAVLLLLIGLDIGGVFLNEYAKKLYERDVQNSTCSILYEGVQAVQGGYKVTMLLQQPRVSFNYTQTVHVFAETINQTRELIDSFPKRCFYIGDSVIFLNKGEGGLPIWVLIFMFLLFDFLLLFVAGVVIAGLAPRLGYNLVRAF